MIIKPQTIRIKWSTTTKNYYKDKGYFFTKINDNFEINIEDLPDKSNINVKCICDFCGAETLRRFSTISKYLKSNEKYTIACNNCTSKKIKETNIQKYGVPIPLQNKEIQKKVKQTCIKKYGVEYSGQADIKKQRTKQTNLKKYGVEYSLQRPEIRQQIKETNIQKYGVPIPLQNKEIQEKMKITNLKKYGVEYIFQNKNIKEKIKKDNIKKYGVEYSLQRPEIRQQIKKTNLKKYGTTNPLQNKEIQNKMKINNLKKYGTEYPMQNKYIKQKAINTLYKNQTAPCSKQQKYIHELLGGELNYPVSRCMLDIAFPDEKIYIEYDGGGHNLQVKKGFISQNEYEQKEIKRNIFIKQNGWKRIRIISSKDLLPDNNIIIKLIINAKKYLLNSNHNWYNINIDESNIQCAEYIKYINIGNIKRI